jgi:hypothetical protein
MRPVVEAARAMLATEGYESRDHRRALARALHTFDASPDAGQKSLDRDICSRCGKRWATAKWVHLPEPEECHSTAPPPSEEPKSDVLADDEPTEHRNWSAWARNVTDLETAKRAIAKYEAHVESMDAMNEQRRLRYEADLANVCAQRDMLEAIACEVADASVACTVGHEWLPPEQQALVDQLDDALSKIETATRASLRRKNRSL